MEIKTADKLGKLFTFFIPVKSLRRYIRRKITTNLIPECLCNDIDDIIEAEFKSSGLKKLAYIYQITFYSSDGRNFFSGGAERYVIDLSRILKRLGYFPVLIQTGWPDSKEAWVKHEFGLLTVGASIDASLFSAVIGKLSDRADINIYSGLFDWGNVSKKNSILISHGVIWDSPFNPCNLKNVLKTYSGNYRRIVSVDTNTISLFRTLFPVKTEISSKFIYIPNYVDTSKFSQSDKNASLKTILFPRRVANERGFRIFAEIVEPLLEEFPHIRIEIAGFIHTEEFHKRILELQERYPQRITHTQVLPDDMPRIYRNAYISLIPSLYCEGTSLSAIEAMASGNIVIASNVGGLPNLILDGYNGLLINPTSKDLINSIRRVLHDENFAEYIRGNAVAVSKIFDKHLWEERWVKIIDELSERQ